MATKSSDPDGVEHTCVTLFPIISVADKTVIHKDDDTYTGLGWSREEAGKNAGDKYRKGEKDE